MPLQTTDFSRFGIQRPDYSGISGLFENYYRGYEGAHTPKRLQEEGVLRELQRRKMGNEVEIAERFGIPTAEANLKLAQANAQYQPSLLQAQIQERLAAAERHRKGEQYAPTTLGKLIKERNALAEKNPNDPLIAQYDKTIAAQGNSTKYAPSPLGKLYGELAEVENGYMPGTDGMVPLTPEEQEAYKKRYDLAIQKHTTDAQIRQTVLRGNNLMQSIDASNIEDLTRYSGPQGLLKLKAEQFKDLKKGGSASPEYYRYLEALQAVKLEAKELRQFFGDSITPAQQQAIDNMVNATSLGKSPEAARAMIQKSRDIIKKQIQTFEQSLGDPGAFQITNTNSVKATPDNPLGLNRKNGKK